LATNQIAQTGLSSLPPVIYYSEQLFSLIRLGLITWQDRDYTNEDLVKFVGKKHYSVPRRIEDYPRVMVDLINDIQTLKNTIIKDKQTSTRLERKELTLTKFGADFIRTVCRNEC
ncbi:hypothetical protein Q7I33_15465, partial [Aeromonas allosaccharophila]|uniref:hypothetical protein n=1 Tax=Aeromonas allosaccharophila TaxID=656 RepID=UPI003006545F